MIARQTTRDMVAGFLRKRFQTTLRGELGFDDPLFSSGVVDSFGVLEIIAFLEDSFRITIDPAKHDLAEFDTVNKMVTLVMSARRPD